MPREAKPPGDYEVGYGKPPRHTRFKPGQSGNPKGRSKGARNVKAILGEELFRSVSIVEGGKRRNVPVFALIVRQSLARAAKGEMRALSALAPYIQRAGLMEVEDGPEPVAQLPLSADEQALLQEFFAGLKAESADDGAPAEAEAEVPR
ncbi:DUF5681 domain-containing protein [Methylobacterium oxalidis]|uniref:DUF5681 domain-containing protein n=1 Tax=Methylobacterium oxalidis TaxID=944322 RepID=A0A512J9Q2_9HYPH|nr:DUF5681 domain-containing protein [Methylobacterium oxalidis]GEP06686.1 hypothetical protein MOX02_47240 [Methylobacterium oxalidis]GJE32929.1 hypothetical protein LDDCCGHA_3126 [Methylobacterium oxalidis]GLS67304.1 hypothetical protein GCM10007888_56870 [Methylobacterium oxalidis]